jgi:thiol-disulfide isomerase/thioredoxin
MLEVSLSPSQAAAAGILLGLLIGQTWLSGLLLRWVHRLSIKVAAQESRPIPLLPGLPVGAPAPPFPAPSLKGGAVSLNDPLMAGKPIFLFCFDVDCGPCKAVFPHLAKWQIERAVQPVFVLLGRNAANRVGAPESDAYNVPSQEDREVAQLDKVPSIPSSLMIKPDRHHRNTLVQ